MTFEACEPAVIAFADMRMNVELSTLPVGVLIGLGVVLVLEIALDVVALIDLVRRPRSTIVFGNKWIWVAVIVLVSLIGAILYLAIGRKPAPAMDTQQQASSPKRSSADIADALYGSTDEPKQQ